MVSEYFPSLTRFLEYRYRSLLFTFLIKVFFGGDEKLVVISSFVY